jgi:hypothetical protein
MMKMIDNLDNWYRSRSLLPIVMFILAIGEGNRWSLMVCIILQNRICNIEVLLRKASLMEQGHCWENHQQGKLIKKRYMRENGWMEISTVRESITILKMSIMKEIGLEIKNRDKDSSVQLREIIKVNGKTIKSMAAEF